MGRPERADLELVTTSQIAKAAGITPRNFALLIDKGLAPEPARQAYGQSGSRAYDGVALAHAALIGALNLAGFELLVAARLAHAFAEEHLSIYGKLVSNLQTFVHPPYNVSGRLPWADKAPGWDKTDRDFWLHRLLRSSGAYAKSKALVGDFVVEIADNKWVMSTSYGLGQIKVFSPVSQSGLPVGLDYRIEGRGSSTQILHLTDEYDASAVFSDPETKQKLKQIEQEFLAARENAVTLVRINVGLSIRDTFDRLYEMRPN